MTTTRLRRVARVADVTDPAVRDAFRNMPHAGATSTERDSVDGWDPLSTEGPNRGTWRLTGYQLIGEVPGRTMYVWRVQVNDGREEFVAVQHGPRGLEVTYAHDYQPASERTRTAATEKARALLVEKVADDAAGPCAQCGGPQSSGRHTTDPHRDGHPFVAQPDAVAEVDQPATVELTGDLAAAVAAGLGVVTYRELVDDARAAHAAGRMGAPALSAVVRRELEGLPVGSARGMAVMQTWADAFTAEVDAAALAAGVAETAAHSPRQWIVTFTETVTHRATVTMRDVLPDGDDYPDRQAAALLDLARDALGTDAVQIVTSSAAFVMAEPGDPEGEAPVLAHERERYEA